MNRAARIVAAHLRPTLPLKTIDASWSSIRMLPGPATEYVRFVPVTVQFDTTTLNSLRTNAAACKSAA